MDLAKSPKTRSHPTFSCTSEQAAGESNEAGRRQSPGRTSRRPVNVFRAPALGAVAGLVTAGALRSRSKERPLLGRATRSTIGHSCVVRPNCVPPDVVRRAHFDGHRSDEHLASKRGLAQVATLPGSNSAFLARCSDCLVLLALPASRNASGHLRKPQRDGPERTR